ncbi:MAG: type II toxin-antitoxin system VapC family toxin [Actinobacteria bacterium]|nr:type II toxin-antitoxin system VapC family toxin [Actinomycetota bacterium]
MNFVLDSSVIIKWFSFIKEDFVEEALKILKLYKNNEIKILIPDLSIYEVSNALRYNSNFSRAEVKEILKKLIDLDLNIIHVDDKLIESAIELSYSDEITVYDAVFIAISRERKIPLISSNPKHHRLSINRNIIPLEDF